MRVPLIETERLRLRAHTAEDWAECAAMWADPAIIRHIGGKPSSRTETWMRVLRYRGLWALLGFGYWAIEDKATHDFIGDIGFADFKREMQPSLDGIPEAGWVLAKTAHGRGYATEALRAILRWGDDHLPDRTTTCIIAPDNIASLRLAHRTGYVEHARAAYHGDPVVVLRRTAGP